MYGMLEIKKNLDYLNMALLGKWLWRYAQEHNNMWRRIIQGVLKKMGGGSIFESLPFSVPLPLMLRVVDMGGGRWKMEMIATGPCSSRGPFFIFFLCVISSTL